MTARCLRAQHHRTADNAADNRVRGRNRQPLLCGKQQPKRCRQKRRHHDENQVGRAHRQRGEVHNARADGVGYLAARNHCAAHFKHGGNQQSLRHGERTRAHRCAERIGHIVAADVERHKNAEQCRHQEQRGLVAVRVAHAPENKIARHAAEQQGKGSVGFRHGGSFGFCLLHRFFLWDKNALLYREIVRKILICVKRSRLRPWQNLKFKHGSKPLSLQNARIIFQDYSGLKLQ